MKGNCMKSTDVGYVNRNNQKNLGYMGVSETHVSAKSYEIECLDCGHKYLTNGCDIWLRKCPKCSVTNRKAKGSSKTKSRTISDKLRYTVLKRDNFKCCACGALPLKTLRLNCTLIILFLGQKVGRPL